MKTNIRVIEHPIDLPLCNDTVPMPDPVPRCWTDPWIRLMRDTTDDSGKWLKTELGVFGWDRGDFIITWKEVQRGALLTDAAPMGQYLVWQK